MSDARDAAAQEAPASRYRIVHTTEYGFEQAVSGCELEARLKPPSLAGQRCEHWHLAVTPEAASSRTARDAFGNAVCHLVVSAPISMLVITSTATIARALVEPALRPVIPWQVVAHRLRSAERGLEAGRPFVTSSPVVPVDPDLMAYASSSFPAGRPLFDATADLVRRIHGDFVYDPSATAASTTAGAALRLRRGVCQDLAHVAIGCLRAKGLPARYVSGYLADSGATGGAHAWASVWVPEWGWVDFDPTLGCWSGARHLTLAWGRDHADVSPLRGSFGGAGAHQLRVSVEVREVAA